MTALPVYLVHYDAPEWCASAAAAVLRSEGVDVVVTVVDNGQKAGAGACGAAPDLAGLLPPGVRRLLAGANLGFAGAANLAIDDWLSAGDGAGGSDYCVIGSHDLHPDPAALARLVQAADNHPSYGVLAATVMAPTISGGGTWDGWRPRRIPPDPNETAEVVRRHWVPATCVLLRKQCVLAVKGFDARLGSYVEDVEFCLRASQAGFDVGYVPAARVRGLGSGSPDVNYWVDRNIMLVAARHRGIGGFLRSVLGVSGATLNAAAGALVPWRTRADRAASRTSCRLHQRALANVLRSAGTVRALLREHGARA